MADYRLTAQYATEPIVVIPLGEAVDSSQFGYLQSHATEPIVVIPLGEAVDSSQFGYLQSIEIDTP